MARQPHHIDGNMCLSLSTHTHTDTTHKRFDYGNLRNNTHTPRRHFCSERNERNMPQQFAHSAPPCLPCENKFFCISAFTVCARLLQCHVLIRMFQRIYCFCLNTSQCRRRRASSVFPVCTRGGGGGGGVRWRGWGG